MYDNEVLQKNISFENIILDILKQICNKTNKKIYTLQEVDKHFLYYMVKSKWKCKFSLDINLEGVKKVCVFNLVLKLYVLFSELIFISIL